MRNARSDIHPPPNPPATPADQQADRVAQQKARYRAYRAAAQQIAQGLGLDAGVAVVVRDQAEVGMIEAGAFVEAVIWVPAGRIAR